MTTEINNTQDVIDSRDIIERIEELEGMEERDDQEQEELDNLNSLQNELSEHCDDWEYGVCLVRESYWVEYVQEMLEDIGTLPADLPSWVHIDWDKTADEVQVDYTSAEFDGVTYWAR